MQLADNIAGQLHLTLHCLHEGSHCRVHQVEIQSSRLRLPPHFFTDKPLETAPKFVGMLFSLCGTAQSIAASRACEQAINAPANAETEQRRAFEIQTETLFEHLLRLAQDWHTALASEPVAPADLQTLFKLKRELLQTTDPAATLATIQQWFEVRLLGLPTQRWLDYCARGDAKKLSIRGKIGNLMARLCMYDWEPAGNITLHALPELGMDWWQARLNAADSAQFTAEPEVNGQACETSSLTRQWVNPALQVWRERWGSGLMTRLMARVLDLLECWQNLQHLPSPTTVYTATPCRGQNGIGMAAVQTARGLLLHRVTQQDGIIQQYQIVAPTEWNFHPRGTLAQMLNGLLALDEVELRAKAQALITALDPCVAYQLEIHHA